MLKQFHRTGWPSEKLWAGDVLNTTATRLPFACPPLYFALAAEKTVEAYEKDIEAQALGWLQHCQQRPLGQLDHVHTRHNSSHP
jgi:hypothetical protein